MPDDGTKEFVRVKRAAQAFVVALLLASAFAAAGSGGFKVTAQTTNEWKGIASFSAYGETGLCGTSEGTPIYCTDRFNFVLPFDFYVTSSGQIHGQGSGSAVFTVLMNHPSDYGCGSYNTVYPYAVSPSLYYDVAADVSGSSASGESATLNIAITATVVNANGDDCIGWVRLPGSTQGGMKVPNPYDSPLGTFSVVLNGSSSAVYPVYSARVAGLPGTYSGSPLCCQNWNTTGLEPSLVRVTLEGAQAAHTSLTCSPVKEVVGKEVSCGADVFGSSPTGGVSFTANSSKIQLGKSSCQLSADPYGGSYSFCEVPVKSSSEGAFKITAHYPGDKNNPPSDGSYAVTFVNPKAGANLALSCTPSVANETLKAGCTAKVTGQAPQPAGNVTWSSANPAGVLSNSTCTPLSGSCGVTYFQGNASEAATITASYSGDAYHLPNEASSTITVLAFGVGTLDQRQTTGFVIKVNGTSGSTVNATSTYYYAQPNDTGKAPFASNSYYDLKVMGGVNGDLQVCHYGANVNSTTSFDYYHDGAWEAATGVVATAGVSVCGDIPGSALSGTPLDIGGSGSSTTASSSSSATASSSSSPTASSTTTSSSARESSMAPTSNSGGGVPEFPYQPILAILLTAWVAASYLVIRRGSKARTGPAKVQDPARGRPPVSRVP